MASPNQFAMTFANIFEKALCPDVKSGKGGVINVGS
jgi:hypothetical protein